MSRTQEYAVPGNLDENEGFLFVMWDDQQEKTRTYLGTLGMPKSKADLLIPYPPNHKDPSQNFPPTERWHAVHDPAGVPVCGSKCVEGWSITYRYFEHEWHIVLQDPNGEIRPISYGHVYDAPRYQNWDAFDQAVKEFDEKRNEFLDEIVIMEDRLRELLDASVDSHTCGTEAYPAIVRPVWDFINWVVKHFFNCNAGNHDSRDRLHSLEKRYAETRAVFDKKRKTMLDDIKAAEKEQARIRAKKAAALNEA